jgi:glycine amidinotransferase
VVDTVEQWLRHWTGYVEETVFDVNMLIIDPKNVMVFNYNQQVFDALARFGITPHVVPFRHRYFWDGGIHCVTCDLHREGSIKNYFPERNQ